MNSILYTPKGEAAEYAFGAEPFRGANLYRGCSGNCLYCSGPRTVHMTREDYANVRPKPDAIRRLGRDLLKEGDEGTCFLSFGTDPYNDQDRASKEPLTTQAIRLLHYYGWPVRLLSKMGMQSTRDLSLLGPGDWFGQTLTFYSGDASKFWEPGTEPPASRIEALSIAHDMGLKTWVSCEPVIDPEETLRCIKESALYVDFYAVGKLNHMQPPNPISWRTFARDVVALLESLGKKYILKNSLRAYSEKGA